MFSVNVSVTSRFQVSGVRFQVSDAIRLQVSGVGFQVSGIQEFEN